MSTLGSLPGIGPVLAQRLNVAGITTAEQLKKAGVNQAFSMLKTAFPNACLSSLYAIACAAWGVPRGTLTEQQKAELKVFFRSL